jgi:hypothetical protein
LQPVAVPQKWTDTRVRVMQADARTLPPSVLAEHAPEVAGKAVAEQCIAVARVGAWPALKHECSRSVLVVAHASGRACFLGNSAGHGK